MRKREESKAIPETQTRKGEVKARKGKREEPLMNAALQTATKLGAMLALGALMGVILALWIGG